ncbi:MAG: RND family transporter [Gammaproteobacteria bacterium]
MTEFASAVLAGVERRAGILLALFLALGALALGGLDYRIGHSYQDWIDPTDPGYQDYRRMAETFGDADTLQAAFPRAALAAHNIADYYALIARLRAADGVLEVYEPAELFLGADEATPPDATAAEDFVATRRGRAPDYRNVLISADADTLAPLILVDPAAQPRGGDLMRTVTEGFRALGIVPSLAGTVVFTETLKNAIASDLARVVALLLGTSLVLLCVFVRDLRAILATVTGIGLSTAFAFAATSVAGLSINLLTLLLVPLVFCVCLTTAIHLFARTGTDGWQLHEAYPAVFTPLAIATFASALGCLAFASAPQAVVARMGLVMPAVVVVTFLTMMLCVPALLAATGHTTRGAGRGGVGLPLPGRAWRHVLAALLMAACLAGAWRLPDLRREPDAFRFFADDSALVSAYRRMEDHLSGMLVVDLVIRATDGVAVTEDSHAEAIERFLAALRPLPGLTTVVSGFDLRRLPGGADALPPGLGSALFSADHRTARVSLRMRNAEGPPYAESRRAIGAAWDSLAPAGLSLTVTGLVPLILTAQDQLLATQGLTLIAGLALICVLLVPFLREPRLLLAALIAIFVPLLVTAGAMAWLDIAVNSINLFVGSVILGLVVDDAIYLLHACRTTGSIEAALAEVGQALTITTLVVGLAFATLAAAELVPVRQFGALSVIAVAAAWLCDCCLIPTLLEARQPA